MESQLLSHVLYRFRTGNSVHIRRTAAYVVVQDSLDAFWRTQTVRQDVAVGGSRASTIDFIVSGRQAAGCEQGSLLVAGLRSLLGVAGLPSGWFSEGE